MRKLYALLAGLIIGLAGIQSNAQQQTADVANFTYAVDAQGNNVNFTNTSTIGSEPGPRYSLWTFGDGSSQWTAPHDGTQHHYQSPGTYTVCLKIYRFTSNTGDTVVTSQVCKTVVIANVCHANFEYHDSITSTSPLIHLVRFWAIPDQTPNNPPVQVCWNFGDGRDTCINITAGTPPTNLLTVKHTYYQQGPFNVCVRIKYLNGCIAYQCKTVVLQDLPHDYCRADFERLPLTSNTGLYAGFQALPWHNNNKRPVQICWTFGDGRDTCIQYSNTNPGPYTVYHLYSAPGFYEVCVKILYQGGCEARNCKNIQIGRPDSCRADFERLPVSTANNPLTVIYKALPWHSNNKKPTKICWSFGDGRDTCIDYLNIYTGLYTVSHTYRQPGQYEVCVKILYYGGCEARKCKSIIVYRPDSCRADFEKIPISTTNDPLRVYFKALPWHNNDRKPARICWNFGDGRDTCITYEQNYTGTYAVGHNYNTPGPYVVCVKISYFGGCEAGKCKTVIIVRPDSCRADFERIPTIASINSLRAYFKALPWHNNNKKPARICWSFGDGRDTCITYSETYSGSYTVAHTYLNAGQYEVCVKILYYGGCDARKCKLIVIPPVGQVECRVKLFEIAPSSTSLLRGFYASASSTPNRRPERICWYFGDGDDTCIMIDPQGPLPDLTIRHTYPGPGIYRACVKIRFQGGCEAHDCIEVVIRSAPNVCGGYMVETQTGPQTFKFKGFSIHALNDQVISYHWTFGDGSAAAGQEVSHTYNHGGEYEVCLSIRTLLGCETRICRTVRVPGNNQSSLLLSPNPVINILHVYFFSTHTEPVSVKILNSNGVQIRSYIRTVTVGPNNWDLDLASLLPGIYSFVVQSPNQLASAIFLKL